MLDEENQTVAVPVTFNRLGDPLEYAVIHRRGKTHEALLFIESKPSILNSALLAVGLVPGPLLSLARDAVPVLVGG